MPERFALYYAPPVDPGLWGRANAWLRRTELQALTVSARRYGFHATLKPPFALAPGTTRAQLEQAVTTFAATRKPVPIGTLVVKSIGGGFLALLPETQTRRLTDFAGECVVAFERFRAPQTTADRAKRLPGLSARQIDLLDRYGYPYVMEQFQFHMTLTDKLGAEDAKPVMAAATQHFAADIGRELVLDRLVLFHEPDAGAPFVRLDDFPLRGS